jgi:hypothetical protein
MKVSSIFACLIAATAFISTGCEDDSSSQTDAAPAQEQEQTSAEENEDTISFTGTVSYQTLEGGFFAIAADDGENYDPTNLPEALAVDGLRVTVTAQIRDDLTSFHMYGVIIDIVDISTL